MFDRDLQEVIRAANKDFLRQAVSRAQTAWNAKQLKEQALSPLENALPVSTIKDFSGEALKRYRSQAKIAAKAGTRAFNRHLIEQGLLREEKGRLIPTGFGFLLFGRNPRRILHQAGILATIHYPNGKDELLDFDEPLILIPDLVEKWLGDKLPSVIDRSRMKRETLPALPFEMVREAVINALIHRDYDIRGAKCQLLVTEDAVTIKSPGAPPPPIALEQLQSFNVPMLSRNPVLHYVFSHMGLAEERGLGVKTLKADAEKEGLPLPKYRFEAPYLALTLFRTPEGAIHALAKGLVDKLNADERAAWQFASTKEALTSRDLMDRMKFDERKAQRVLNKLLESKLLRRVGRGPATRYEIVRS
jgi:ATP-dependent DNA helicase RecG